MEAKRLDRHRRLSYRNEVEGRLGLSVMKLLQKCVILSHRYLGIALCLLVVMWFASGIVMIYAGGMPRLTPQLRLERMPVLDLTQVKLTPAEAAERIGLEVGRGAGRTVLGTVMNRPAYRFGGQVVFADSGELLNELSLGQARTAASRFANLPEEKVRHIATLTKVDQWTLGQGRQLPLHKFAVDDGQGTEVYIQPQTGEVAMLTTRNSRALAWMGTIPHWLYFTALRSNQPVWYKIVVWTSGLVCVAAALGMILAVTQFRKPRPFRLSVAIPYKGWMRWHYVTGAVFGLFTLTWAFSGLLSMEPFAWTRAEGLEVRRDVFSGGPVDLAQFEAMDPGKWNQILGGHGVKEVEYTRIQGDHYYIVRHASANAAAATKRERLHQPYNLTGQAEQDRLLISAKTLEVRHQPFSVESLVSRLKAAVPDVPITEQQLLSEYDSYYYSRGRRTPLPVLRVKFDDPARTWFYIDPEMSQMLATVHRVSRLERWLYNGLHSLDFSFWYNQRPLWDIGMIVLLSGGLISSALGALLGVKRIRRNLTWKVKSLATESPGSSDSRISSLYTDQELAARMESPDK